MTQRPVPAFSAAAEALNGDAPQTRARLRIGFILVPNFTLLPFAAFVDAIRLAADEGDRSRQIDCRWTVMGATSHPITASCGVRVEPWEPFRDPSEFDYVAVVGGLLQGSRELSPELRNYLRLVTARRKSLIGVGTGTFVLARAGVLTGHRCCVSWYHFNEFREEFPDIPAIADQTYLIDRDRITCAGGAGVVDLASRLIERHCGLETALKSLRMILADAPRLPTAPQPQPLSGYRVADPRVRRAILLIEQNLTNPLSLPVLARAVSLSPRQLERAVQAEMGMSVMELSRYVRLKHAQWLLVHSERPITAIAQECGFSDSSHFSRVFRRQFGTRPSRARRVLRGGLSGASAAAPQ